MIQVNLAEDRHAQLISLRISQCAMRSDENTLSPVWSGGI